MSLAEKIRSFVAEHPGSTSKQITDALGLSAGTHCSAMAVAGRLSRVRRERSYGSIHGPIWHYYLSGQAPSVVEEKTP